MRKQTKLLGSQGFTNSIDGVRIVVLDEDCSFESIDSLNQVLADVHQCYCPTIVELIGIENGLHYLTAVIRPWLKEFLETNRSFALCTANEQVLSIMQHAIPELRGRSFSKLSEALDSVRPGTNRPLGQILVEDFQFDVNLLNEALKKQSENKNPLGQILICEGLARPLVVASALYRQTIEAKRESKSLLEEKLRMFFPSYAAS